MPTFRSGPVQGFSQEGSRIRLHDSSRGSEYIGTPERGLSLQTEVRCPLKDVVVRRCKVSSCMWHDVRSGQCGFNAAADDNDLADLRAISRERIEPLKREGRDRARRLMILYRYHQFILDAGLHIAFRDRPRKKFLRVLVQYPFNIEEFSWTTPMLAAAVTQSNYRAFCKATGLKDQELSELLGVSEKRLRRMKVSARSIQVKGN